MARFLVPELKAGRHEAVLEPVAAELVRMLGRAGLPLNSVEGSVPILVPLVYASRRAAAAASAAGAEQAAEQWRTSRKSPPHVVQGMELLQLLLCTRAQYPTKHLDDLQLAYNLTVYAGYCPEESDLGRRGEKDQMAAASKDFFRKAPEVMKELSEGPSECAACGATSKRDGQPLAVCSVCKSAGYCSTVSTACHKADWKAVHRRECQALVKEAAKPVMVAREGGRQGQAGSSRG
jgi:hypothetical protein